MTCYFHWHLLFGFEIWAMISELWPGEPHFLISLVFSSKNLATLEKLGADSG